MGPLSDVTVTASSLMAQRRVYGESVAEYQSWSWVLSE